MHVCVYICMYLYTYVWCIYAYIDTSIRVCLCLSACACNYVCIFISRLCYRFRTHRGYCRRTHLESGGTNRPRNIPRKRQSYDLCLLHLAFLNSVVAWSSESEEKNVVAKKVLQKKSILCLFHNKPFCKNRFNTNEFRKNIFIVCSKSKNFFNKMAFRSKWL